MGEMHNQSAKPYDLFISYVEGDRAWVEGYLLEALDRAEIEYHSEQAFHLGAPRLLEFERAIEQSRRVLLVLSPAYLSNGFSQFTDVLAQHFGIETGTWPVIPVQLHSIKMPSRLQMLVGLDATNRKNWPDVIERLCDELEKPVLGPTPRPPCPYPGMIPFTDEQADRFFGRDAEIKTLRRRLRHEDLLFVIGPSGCGKSSLVFAGLIPDLRESHPNRWLVRTMRPGASPREALVEALDVTVGTSTLDAQVVEALLEAHERERLLLVVDQFEELFTQSGTDVQARFIKHLHPLREADQCRVVLTMRADYYPDLMRSGIWNIAKDHRFEIIPLHGEKLRAAIEEPSRKEGVYIEAALLERLLSDAAEEPGVLPLLQETMNLLWEEMERRLLPVQAYEDLGTDGRSGLEVALAMVADAVYTDMTSGHQRIAQRVLLRLVQFGEGRPDTRRQRRLAELRGAEDDLGVFDEVIEQLSTSRLITLSGEEEEESRRVDLSHEALIEGWPRLQKWLQKLREAEQVRRRLESEAEKWERLSREGGLLDEVELREAEAWADSEAAVGLGGFSDRLAKLVAASRAAIEEREQEEEAARQRDIERAQELESALNEKNRQLSISESQRLAFASRSVSGSEPEVALLLACEAAKWDVNPLVDKVLRSALSGFQWQVTNFEHHIGSIHSAVFDQVGRHILTASGDKTARLWATDGRSLVTYNHTDEVTSAVFSPDEQQVLTTTVNSAGHLWRRDGQHIRDFVHPDAAYTGFRPIGRFSPDGTHILICNCKSAWLWRIDGTFQPIPWYLKDEGTAYLSNLIRGKHTWPSDWRQVHEHELELAKREGHVGDIYSAVFSPDAQKILTASEDSTARLWDLKGRQLTIYEGHTSQVINAIFSPTGEQRILTGSIDGTARLWSEEGMPLAVMEGHKGDIGYGDVGHLAFSPDGSMILTATDDLKQPDFIAWLWNSSGNLVATLGADGDSGVVKNVAFSPDGNHAITASEDRTAIVWDLTGSVVAKLKGHADTVVSATFSRDGRSVLTASKDGTARVWKPERSALPSLYVDERGLSGAIYCLGGTHILTGSWDTWLWHKSGQLIAKFDGEPIVRDDRGVINLGLSPDQRYLLTFVESGGRVWELPTHENHLGNEPCIEESGFSGKLSDLFRSHLELNPSMCPEPVAALSLPGDHYFGATHIQSGVFSADSHRILTSGGGGATCLWDLGGSLIARLRGPNLSATKTNNVVDYVSFSPDSQHVVGGCKENGTVWIWSVDGDLISSFHTEDWYGSDNLFGVAVCPDGERILTTIRNKAGFWTLNGDHISEFDCAIRKPNRLVFSPSGKRILLGNENRKERIYLYSRNGELLKVLSPVYRWTTPIVFGNSKEVFSIGDGNVARVWDFDGNSIADCILNRDTFITDISLNATDEQVLIACADGTTHLWSIVDKPVLKSTFQGHKKAVDSAVFSPDGSRVLTASSDGTARQFLVAIRDLLSVAERRLCRKLNPEEAKRFNLK